jgi:hypothetical protein
LVVGDADYHGAPLGKVAGHIASLAHRRAFFACLVAAALAGAVTEADTAFDPGEIVRQALAVADALLEGLDAPPARP